jgi:hypothetical protein
MLNDVGTRTGKNFAVNIDKYFIEDGCLPEC